MADEFDAYQPCPCGSGKKIKFCCQAILGDMLKIGEMKADGQIALALQALEALDKKNVRESSSRAWIKSDKALMLLAESRFAEAGRAVDEALAEMPEHSISLVIHAILALYANGYPGAMRDVYKALQAVDAGSSKLAGRLAAAVAELVGMQGHFLSSVEYLSLALHLNQDDERSRKAAAEIVCAAYIPYPLRVRYRLAALPAEVAADDKLRALGETALQLAGQGVFSDAAKAFGQIARQHPNSGDVWWNVALCHAWAGEDPLAAEAFKAAAANRTDVESAADCLLLSRLLARPADATRIGHLKQSFKVSSVSRLLSTLDRQPRCIRSQLSSDDEYEDSSSRLAAIYGLIDRDLPTAPPDEWTLDDVPRVLGKLSVFDTPADEADGETAGSALLVCDGRDRLVELNQWLAVAPELAIDGQARDIGGIRPELRALIVPLYLPPGLSPANSDRLLTERWRRIVEEIWPNTPQETLQQKTPLQAAAVPELRTALVAAVVAFEVFAEQDGSQLDTEALRARLGLPPCPTIEISADEEPLSRTVLELRRLDLAKLSDSQLRRVSNMWSRLDVDAWAEPSLREMVSRPSLADKIDLPASYMELAELARRRHDIEQGLELIQQGRDASRAGRAPLDIMLLWEVEELVFRAKNPDDPKVAELAANLWNYYRPKLPEAALMIESLLKRMNLPGPWNSAAEPAPGGALEAAGVSTGIWTPEAQAPAGEPSKLWLPGS